MKCSVKEIYFQNEVFEGTNLNGRPCPISLSLQTEKGEELPFLLYS